MNSSLPHRLTRRQMLRLLAPAVAIGITNPCRFLHADPAEGNAFTFISINDLHYLDADCGTWFRRVVEAMHASAPDAALCLISGDLSDKGTADALIAVRDLFGGLGIPMHAVPGNHDYLAQTDRTGYDAIFPDKLNYRFMHKGWQFIGLDTTEGLKAQGTLIAPSTLRFLEEEHLESDAPTIVFTHFPLGEGVSMRPKNADALLERLFKLNLRAAFSGHWHGASERVAGHAVLTTDRCCSRIRQNADGSPLKGWFVCDAKPDGSVTRRFVTAPPLQAA
jgi:3',5'-cyclic AMP phosphodiesterase CpdA